MPYSHEHIQFAKQLRKNMTPWERKLWHLFLKTYAYRFQRQKPIGEYIVDFYCAKAMLIVELDGGGHYEPEKIQKDLQRTKFLESNHYFVLRFSNRDVDEHFYEVCTVIDETVKKRLLPQSKIKDF